MCEGVLLRAPGDGGESLSPELLTTAFKHHGRIGVYQDHLKAVKIMRAKLSYY